jgi:hypothetical protein
MVMPKKKVLPEWKTCETTKKIDYERQGCLVIPTGKGHDFLTICPNQKPTFVEVKQGCGALSEFQKKTMNEVRKNGFEYKVERCSCSKRAERNMERERSARAKDEVFIF